MIEIRAPEWSLESAEIVRHLKGVAPSGRFWLKNGLLACYLAVLLAILVLFTAVYYQNLFPFLSRNFIITRPRTFFGYNLLSLILIGIGLYIFERPIRRCFDQKALEKPDGRLLLEKARKRVLNEPFFGAGLFFSCRFLAGSSIYAILASRQGIVWRDIQLNLADSLVLSFITCLLILTILSIVVQKFYTPFFFPFGGLSRVSGVLKMKLKFRLGILLWAFSIMPILTLVRAQIRVAHLGVDPAEQFKYLSLSIWVIGLLSIALSIFLTFLFGGNIVRSAYRLVEVLHRVARGDFSSRVSVTANDEIGYIGDVVNEMNEGLMERDRMRQHLHLAKEVQQSMLPRKNPEWAGLDAAGESVYCDEIGGDYYDFLDFGEDAHRGVGLVVGDVSDHGVQAALMMASARSLIRQNLRMHASPAVALTEVNRQMARDVEETGQFMTLFFAEIDVPKKTLTWVNSGHDAALLYDSTTDGFMELSGGGPALGLDGTLDYRETNMPLIPGGVLVIGTDGIWEAHAPDGEPFGKERLKGIIRSHADLSAESLVRGVIRAVEEHRQPLNMEDDITLIVVRFIPPGPRQGS